MKNTNKLLYRILEYACSNGFIRVKDCIEQFHINRQSVQRTMSKLIKLGYMTKVKNNNKKSNSTKYKRIIAYTYTPDGYLLYLFLQNDFAFNYAEIENSLYRMTRTTTYQQKLTKVLTVETQNFFQPNTMIEQRQSYLPDFTIQPELKLYADFKKNTRAEKRIYLSQYRNVLVKARKVITPCIVKHKDSPNTLNINKLSAMRMDDTFYVCDRKPYVLIELKRLYAALKYCHNAPYEYYNESESPYSPYIPIDPFTNNPFPKERTEYWEENGVTLFRTERWGEWTMYPWTPVEVKKILHKRRVECDGKCEAECKDCDDHEVGCEADHEVEYEAEGGECAKEEHNGNKEGWGDYPLGLENITPYEYKGGSDGYCIPVIMKRIGRHEYRVLRQKYHRKLFLVHPQESESKYITRVYESALRIWQKDLNREVEKIIPKGNEAGKFKIGNLGLMKCYLQQATKFESTKYEYYTMSKELFDKEWINTNTFYYLQKTLNDIAKRSQKYKLPNRFKVETRNYIARGYLYHAQNMYAVYNLCEGNIKAFNNKDFSRTDLIQKRFFIRGMKMDIKYVGAIVLAESHKIIECYKAFVFSSEKTVFNEEVLKNSGIVDDMIYFYPICEDGSNLCQQELENSVIIDEILSNNLSENTEPNGLEYIDRGGDNAIGILHSNMFEYYKLQRVISNNNIYDKPIAVHCWEWQVPLVQYLIERLNSSKLRKYVIKSYNLHSALSL